MDTERLTARQSEVLELIRTHIADTGYPPTRADIASELGFKSPNAAEEHLKALARKGAIEIIPGTSRGIRLPDSSGLPIVGKVAAGNPILSEEHIEDFCQINGELFRPPANYLLRVEGDSMKNVGIMDGDLLAVHNTSIASNGDIVVARINDEVTVKRFKQGKSKAELLLLPENEDFDPIVVNLKESTVTIEGKSVGVIRLH